MNNKKITRKSDKFHLVDTGFSGTAWCPHCNHGVLKPMKNNEFDLKCWECGEVTPIKAVRFETKPGEMDTSPGTVVQPKTGHWRRGLVRERPKNPLEQELIGHGFQVIDSDWRDQRER
jgi:hypothetical protein